METSLKLKLISIVVHADEMLGPDGHQFDAEAMKALLVDPEVREFVDSVKGLAPIPRGRLYSKGEYR